MNDSSVSRPLPTDLEACVRQALAEDIGTGDVTAALLAESAMAQATVISREEAVLCGTAWFTDVYRQIDPEVVVQWQREDGATIRPDQIVCSVSGRVRSLLTGERTALNFLQTLSGTATRTHRYVELVAGTSASILDTRKTLPGLRTAQKYAVACGGGTNHRMGLYDAILLKENHIAAAGNIQTAVTNARQANPGLKLEVEVETLAELTQALEAGVDFVLLDNFTLSDIRRAVNQTAGAAKLEVSGGVELASVRGYAETGVDYISVGDLTKNIQAVDLSMRLTPDTT